MIKVLFLGDVVGRPGREFLIEKISELRSELSLHAVVVNAENAAGGSGITESIASDLLSAGVDAITLGDHVWDQKNFENEIDELNFVCRPANLPNSNPGRDYLICEINGSKVGVFTVLGRSFMGPKVDCPFATADKLVNQLETQVDQIICEIHAETTSEKESIGWFLDGRVSLVFGTHTHVPTSDARILPNGTAFQTDVGMCGNYDSVIGMEKSLAIDRFFSKKSHLTVAEGEITICGVCVETDDYSGKSLSIEPIRIGGVLTPT